ASRRKKSIALGFSPTISTLAFCRPCPETPHSSSFCSSSASSLSTRSAGGGASPSGNAAGAATGMTTSESGSSERWLSALETRHFSELTFQEVARALRALSATYVERRDRIRSGATLAGAGKRAAFALFYGPLHYLLVREIVRALADSTIAPTLVDLGC